MMIEIHGSIGGTQLLFSVKYLFEEAKIERAWRWGEESENARFRKTTNFI